MSLKRRILNLLGKKPISLQYLYKNLADQKKETIRGRLYESMGQGVVKRVGKGLYISATTITEFGDSRKIINEMLIDNDKFDFIFLDIPYQASGTQGGNRNLFTLDKISVDDFQDLLPKLQQLLKDENSPLCFMFTSGKSSIKDFKKYNDIFKNTDLKLAISGSYEKMWSNGKPMNMGKYKMPKEHILLYNLSGQLPDLGYDIQAAPKFSYPTAKPYSLIKELVEKLTKPLDWVLDPFVGSGVIVKVCQDLGRFCHVIDNAETSVKKFVLPIMQTRVA